MNKIESLKKVIKKQLPQAKIAEDPPTKPGAAWFLDVSCKGRSVTLQWKPQKGFGLSSNPAHGYGEGPHEVFADAKAAAKRAVELLVSGDRTFCPKELPISRLRDVLGVSQEELARKLNMQQATISRMERQTDMRISTLRKLIDALGGQLQIRARLGDETICLVQFEESPKQKPSRKVQASRSKK